MFAYALAKDSSHPQFGLAPYNKSCLAVRRVLPRQSIAVLVYLRVSSTGVERLMLL